MDQEDFELLLRRITNANQNNEPSVRTNFLESQENNHMDNPESDRLTEEIIKAIIKSESETPKTETLEEPSLLSALQDFTKTIERSGNQEQLNPMLSFSALLECAVEQNVNNNSNEDTSGNNQIDMADTTSEWLEEYHRLERDTNLFSGKVEDSRRRQMAKNREYARKCVQKKKDMRKDAEIRSLNISRKVDMQLKISSMKETNANFAVELTKMNGDVDGEEQRKLYEQSKLAVIKEYEDSFGKDEAANLTFHKFASAREEYEKATIDLREKNGVVGTLGSRKIRAKQQMEWRKHLYDISVNEHKLRREIKLSDLLDDYIRKTVPKAAPLVQSIPKNLLDKLIKNNKTSELEDFVRFVSDNTWMFATVDDGIGDE